MMATATLTLKVVNSEKLLAGLAPLYSLDSNQSIAIGAAKDNDWRLNDIHAEIAPHHCRIFFSKGQFIVEDCCGQTRINNSTLPIGLRKKACLANNHSLEIGPYQIRVYYANEHELANQDFVLHEQESLLESQLPKNNLQKMAISGKQATVDEPLAALANSFPQSSYRDLLVSPNESHSAEQLTVKTDNQDEMTAAITLKNGTSNRYNHFHHATMNTSPSEKYPPILDEALQQHLGQPYDSGKISAGLGLSPSSFLSINFTPQEIAEGLQAAIRGLLALHQQIADTRYRMINKNLQPIEDNPLRLGLSYEATLQILFDVQQPGVHLTTAAAIEESLRILGYHNEAVQQATNEALQQILYAFSPEVLLRRFSRYRTNMDNPSITSESDEWAWNMYRSYYHELISERQQGFEKLFWEIFEQSYDKTIRKKQLERE